MPNTKLVETTLELAVADLVKAAPVRTSSWSRLKDPAGLILACLVTGLVAWGGAKLYQSYAFNRQLSELAIAESMDAYFYAGDLDLMRALAEDPQWTQMVTASRQLEKIDDGFANQSEVTLIASVPLGERASLIRSLPIDQRTQFFSRWERYNRADEKSRAKIQQVADVVARQTDHEKLIKTMRAYANWRESLPAETVDMIEGSTGKAQREAVAAAIEKTMAAISERSSRQLSDDAIESIYFVLRKIFAQRLAEFPPEVRERVTEMRERMPGEADSEWWGLNLMFGQRDSRRRTMSSGGMSEFQEPLRADEIELIRLILAPEDLTILNASSGGGDPVIVPMTIRNWAEEAIRRKSPWPRRENMTPIERFMDVPEERRQEFELLPPEKMLEEMNRSWGRFSG